MLNKTDLKLLSDLLDTKLSKTEKKFNKAILNLNLKIKKNIQQENISNFEAIKDYINFEINEKIREAIKNELSSYMNKNELTVLIDKVVGELKTIREEHAMLSNRIYDDHQQRIDKIWEEIEIMKKQTHKLIYGID